jgi:O-antigen ligase
MFLKGGWKSKLVCLVSGVFVTNGIILSRSRGIFLALAAGVISAVVFSIKQRRMKIMFGLSVGIMGAILLTDPGFWNRMDEISVESSKIDKSTKGRILAWDAALSMAADYPLGIGEGNFRKYVDKYNPNIPGKDTHNTFLRCLSELGVQGLIVYLLMIANAFNILRKLKKQVKGMDRETDFVWHIYGIKISIILFVSAGMFISHTYIEELYWLLMFPVFLKRSVENQKALTIKMANHRLQEGLNRHEGND